MKKMYGLIRVFKDGDEDVLEVGTLDEMRDEVMKRISWGGELGRLEIREEGGKLVESYGA